jgi:type I restriction enzyme S subunit
VKDLKPYPGYKHSGIDWLGTVPAEWSAKALRYLAVVETGSKDTADADADGEFPFIVRSPKLLRINTFSYDTEAILTAGDGDVGEIFHHMTGKFDAHQRVYVLRAFLEVDPRFLYYYFSSQFINVVAYGGIQTTVSSLRRPMFTSFPVLVPDRQTQRSIASFLDRETAEIDAFIADQEELIELLAERRAATISHAVTKGLDPNVPMKDSGVEWLGEVPAHWALPRVAHVARCSSGNGVDLSLLEPKPTQAANFPVFGGNGIVGYGAHSNSVAGSLAIGRVGALCGNVHSISESSWISDNALRLRLHPVKVDQTFMREVLVARKLNDLADKTAQPLITGTLVMAQRIPIPPLTEQREIANFVVERAAELDAALADAREAISLSRERRSALISAAVTGKIDVREHGAVT